MSSRGAALIFGVVLLSCSIAEGGTGFRIMLPGWPQKPGMPTLAPSITKLAAPTTPATGNKTGLVLTLDTTWVEGNGYRPVRITVTPTTPTTADRSLRVSFRPGGYRNASVAVTRDIELPAGFVSVTTKLSVPQLGPWYSIAFDVFENGEHLRELSIPQNFMGMGGTQYSADAASPAILILNSSASTFAILNALGKSGQPVMQIGPSNTVSTSSYYVPGNPPRQIVADTNATIASMGDLPDRWIDYSMLDVIVASRQDMQTLVDRHPPQWRAIRRWIAAGGNLVVYGVGELKQPRSVQWNPANDKPWQHLDDLNQWIRFPSTDESAGFAPTEPATRGWRPADFSDVSQTNFGNYNSAVYGTGTTPTSGTRYLVPNVEGQEQGHFPFALRALGQGVVVAIPDADPTNPNANTPNNLQFPWDLVFGNLGLAHWNWVTRNGVGFSQENDHYWNFLIPDVGAAPVTSFQVLITLFVLAIGPINFYVLRRWNKLNLLLVTVPVCAGVITLGLLFYAIFADGFGVRTRTRSFTEIDQRTGEAVCLGRMTYYAGLTPSAGLAFSGDTTVYPLSESAIGDQYASGITRRLAWVSDEELPPDQHLESGWLQSRIQAQLLTVRARKTPARLKINTDGDRVKSVINQLGVPVSRLLVCDSAGGCHIARDIAPDSTAPLEQFSPDSMSPELEELQEQKVLEPPQGVQLGGSDAIFGIRRRAYRRYNTGGATIVTDGMSMLERSLDRAIEAFEGGPMPRRSYIAIVPVSPEFQLGLDGATTEDSFHVIEGHW
jgi:hypothetical protein